MITHQLIINLLLILVVAWVLGSIFDRFGLPVMLGELLAFFGLTILAGEFILPRFTLRLHDREGKAFTFAMTCDLAMAYLAELAGLHLIIGAFLAGQFVRREIMDSTIYERISDRFFGLSYGFLVSIFFASLSFHLRFDWSWPFVMFAGTLTLMAIIGKLLGCGLGLYPFRRSLWESVVVGFGLNGRGAVELVMATVVIGMSGNLLAVGHISEPLLTTDQFTSLILMAFITTLMAPITLKWAIQKTWRSDYIATASRLG